jgi:DNA invertase Pin-like site-specific DNA recombinase
MNYIFIRTSTKEQEPTLQLDNIVSTFRVESYKIIIEKDSAFKEKAKRVEFEKLKKLISAGKVSQLFVWDLDRIHRNRKKLIEFLALCKIYKTKVYSYNQQWMQSIQQIQEPFNEIMFDMMLSIMGWLAEDESAKKSNRVKMAVRRTESGTLSYKGAKWGRKALSKQVVSKIQELHKQEKSIREIAQMVQVYDNSNNGRNISKSAVHKIITSFDVQKGSI